MYCQRGLNSAVAAPLSPPLLYGRPREGFKRKGERYKLFWPERAEFVRMAAKLGAQLVPVSCVGAEDSLELILDSDEVQRHALLGEQGGMAQLNLSCIQDHYVVIELCKLPHATSVGPD